MTTGDAGTRHKEALRLFEAGLRAFYEATGTSVAPTWQKGRDDESRLDRVLDPRPPAPTPERSGDLADAR